VGSPHLQDRRMYLEIVRIRSFIAKKFLSGVSPNNQQPKVPSILLLEMINIQLFEKTNHYTHAEICIIQARLWGHEDERYTYTSIYR
jgi:hypothetical protein